MEPTQREKLAALLTQEQTAVLVTQGEKWPTVNLQAFAATVLRKYSAPVTQRERRGCTRGEVR